MFIQLLQKLSTCFGLFTSEYNITFRLSTWPTAEEIKIHALKKIYISRWKHHCGFFFLNRNIPTSYGFQTKKNSSWSVVSFKSYENLNTFFSRNKIQKKINTHFFTLMCVITARTLNFNNFWSKQYFGLIFFLF